MPCWQRQGKHQVNPRRTSGQARFEFGDDVSESSTRVIRAPVFQAATPQELDQLFEAAQARGNEGLMIKDPESPYTPGRRGKSWLKLKRELATLDVVVTAVEYGHGKRIGVLSDYTFAVRDGDKLVNIGKAYSGLTDAEIAEMTRWFLEHTIEDQGFRLVVEPKIVLEVAFNNMMRIRPARERVRIALSADRQAASRQVAGRGGYDREGEGDLREAAGEIADFRF